MAAPFFHVGVVVGDLDAAIPRFAAVFRVTFNRPTRMPARVESADGSSYERELRITYSREGPPYLELVQGFDTGFFSLEHGEGLHHVGVWTPPADPADVASAAALEADRFASLHPEVTLDAGLMVLKHTAPSSLHGVRLELFDERIRAQVEGWIKS